MPNRILFITPIYSPIAINGFRNIVMRASGITTLIMHNSLRLYAHLQLTTLFLLLLIYRLELIPALSHLI